MEGEIQIKAQVYILSKKLFKYIHIIIVTILILLEFRQWKKKLLL